MLELMSIYQPFAIGPNVPLLLERVRVIEYQQFLCPCTALFKAEHSHRKHMSGGPHRHVQEVLSTLTEVFDKLPTLDMELLGDASRRRGDLLGSYETQKLRLMKHFAIRKIVKGSDKTRPILE
jgi:hypothetical protein